MELIKALQANKILINLDETWLGMSDFRRMKWRPKGTRNSVAKRAMTPRISMMVALDTLGNVYMSLYQSNSNNKLMEIILISLVKKLNQERPNWRNDSVLFWDNAPYHAS